MNELLDAAAELAADSPFVAAGDVILFAIIVLAVLYGFGLLESLALWANARWPVSRQQNDKIVMPTAWNFNVNKHTPDHSDSADHGFDRHKQFRIDWAEIERRYPKLRG